MSSSVPFFLLPYRGTNLVPVRVENHFFFSLYKDPEPAVLNIVNPDPETQKTLYETNCETVLFYTVFVPFSYCFKLQEQCKMRGNKPY
jgi:hypothetical protein